jgi:hypothetical protein
MTQLNLHNKTAFNPPPLTNLSIIQKLISSYKLWHEFLPSIPRTSRYSLGIKIDNLFIETTEFIYLASRANKDQKLPFLQKASAKLDLLKFFLQIAWEIKSLDNKKYLSLSEILNEIGRMLGGWSRQSQLKQNPALGGVK